MLKPLIVEYPFKPKIWGGFRLISVSSGLQPVLQSEFQQIQVYTEKPCLKKQTKLVVKTLDEHLVYSVLKG